MILHREDPLNCQGSGCGSPATVKLTVFQDGVGEIEWLYCVEHSNRHKNLIADLNAQKAGKG